ncbi:FAD-dependent oxidoreductase [Treponema brennaborense]|uniref:Dihydrolipoyl dehydrogenase n=1 Tax=Treponema brennaborense (strain DSM 12168 / CIP 105900 / DD5/3) TaxID=906968 RepID=F4LNI0_TREBD|nr:FAD-dependent oxidoreductase [Treponema brennaborense]AEE15834.1 Dihydrolipoyl dehydrogenase [Treponema brennaborense DSM 12168]
MKHFDSVIIGFGKAGKTLAAALAAAGKSVALIERSPAMYGGTCINVACIPTKALEYNARLSAAAADAHDTFERKAARYRTAVAEKRVLTAMLRQKNLEKLQNAGVTVLTGTASFISETGVSVALNGGGTETLEADTIVINTGSLPFVPPIEGLNGNRFVHTSESLMELDELPARMIVIGGGYIGMEFASLYANFGTEVTVVQDGAEFLPREDAQISAAVRQHLENRGVKIIAGARILSVREDGEHALVTVQTENGQQELGAEAVLVATGRRPNLEALHPEAAGIELTERGAVKTDEHLRTSVPHIFAAGDVAGGLQFTYISLDDSRILKSQLLGTADRTTKNRGAVPYSVFMDPPLSRVGLTEAEARAAGYDVAIASLPAAAVPKAHILKQSAGLLKAVVDSRTGLILGAHLFCAESHEMINLVKLAIDAKLPYTQLRDGIFTHPTMSEALNDLFAALP